MGDREGHGFTIVKVGGKLNIERLLGFVPKIVTLQQSIGQE